MDRIRNSRTLTMLLGAAAVVAAMLLPVGLGANTSTSAGAATSAIDKASTSTRGVTSKSINVVFPVANIGGLASEVGFAGDPEDPHQVEAIHTYVNQLNEHGGIHGRTIHADIVSYDPTNETQMRALCKQWTQGSPGVFAVVDGLGSWSGADQLCITQEGHTPMLAEWTTVDDWTKKAAPYLWWLGASQSSVLQTVVTWGLSSGLIGPGKKVGVLVGDRASDQEALKTALLPALHAAGILHPDVETIAANPNEESQTESDAPLVVQHFRAAGVTSVIPLVPVNAYFPYLQAETQQSWYPHLLLSDYESLIDISLGLIPTPYNKALNGQEGVTTMTLGGIDDPRPVSQGGYDAGVRSCWNTWHAENHNFPTVPPEITPYIEEQGPIVSWCQSIKVLGAALQKAGRNLNRRTFVQGMASIKNFPGTLSPVLSYGPNKYYGPTSYRVVRLHTNVAGHNECILRYNKTAVGTCWQLVQNWRPLISSS